MTKPFILTTEDRTKLRRRVLATLKTGRHSAITGKRIAHTLGQSDDRKIRLVIRELIAEGVPIASSVSEPMGFYLVGNEHEAAVYIRVLKERIREDMTRLRDFEAACHQFAIPEQRSLFEEVRDAFAVHAVKVNDSGDGLRLLQEHLGHQSIVTTMRYRKVAGEEHREWFEKLWE